MKFPPLISQEVPSKKFLFLLVIAYIFSVLVHSLWIYNVGNFAPFLWNGTLMINTNDGYYWAEGARDILQGIHQEHDGSPIYSPISQLTALLVQVTPFSLEKVILYMPVFFGSLLVVPIMLITRILKLDYVGFIAALIGSIAWSYYNRTMAGYYDTDILVIVLPTFTLWSLVYAFTTKHKLAPLVVALLMEMNYWWYAQSYSLLFGMTVTVFIYILLFHRKEFYAYEILLFMLLALIQIPFEYQLILTFIVWGVFYAGYINNKKAFFTLFGAVLFFVFITGGFTPIVDKIGTYIFHKTYQSDMLGDIKLHYYAVNKTVREAGQIPFEVFANRISGSVSVWFFALIGYIMLVLHHRIFLLSLPMLGLGFLAYFAGLRFTVYAVPVMALGGAYMIFLIAQFFSSYHPKAKWIVVGILGIYMLYPNIQHAINYNVPTVFTNKEVKVLDKFKNIASREDYVLTWWDYGYPIRYYSDVKTLVDGGKHIGKVNFPVSFSLTKDQVSAANMARLDVEYTERSYQEKFNSNLVQEMKEYGFSNPNEFLAALKSKNFKTPLKTRDTYFLLPNRMLDILPTVAVFSNIDLFSGKVVQRPFFYQAKRFKGEGNRIYLGNNIEILKDKGAVKIGKQMVLISRFIVTEYDTQGKLHVDGQVIHPTSGVNVIFMKNYNRFLVLDDKMYNSTYIQLYVLENYDKDLYEPVIMDPLIKIYKLKK